MANALYDHGRDNFLNAGINWTSDNVKALLVNTASYTVNLATHTYLSDVTSGAIAATSPNLASKSSAAGVANAAAFTFTSVPTGAACGAVILYKDTGTSTTSPLICYIDTATGLPVTPNGGNITFTPDSGANKLFKL